MTKRNLAAFFISILFLGIALSGCVQTPVCNDGSCLIGVEDDPNSTAYCIADCGPKPGSLEVTVISSFIGGTRLSDAKVVVEGYDSNFSATEYANSDGIALFESVPPGAYKITASKEGYLLKDANAEVTAGQTTSIRIKLQFHPEIIKSCKESGGIICEDYEVCKGVILKANDTNRCCLGTCTLPESFDWRNRHGENWMTPIRDQGNAGNCFIFGKIGSFESQINLYFNQHLNADLSEQIQADCIEGIQPGSFLFAPECTNYDCVPANRYCNFIHAGIPDEQCDSYNSRWPNPNNCDENHICSNWKNRTWKNSDFYDYTYGFWNNSKECPQTIVNFSNDDLKKIIIEKGPPYVRVDPWSHGMVLTGYLNNKSDWKTINYCNIGNAEFCIPSKGCISRVCNNIGEEIKTCVNDYQYYFSGEVNSGIYTYKCENRSDEENYFVLKNSISCSINQICINNECVNSAGFQLKEGQIECTKYHADFDQGFFNGLVRYSPNDGDTIWVFKNSWGENYGDEGYIKFALPSVAIKELSIAIGPFVPPLDKQFWPSGFNNKIKCVDKDNDNFCNWGITKEKPSTCPSNCKNDKDWDDSNSSIGALGLYEETI